MSRTSHVIFASESQWSVGSVGPDSACSVEPVDVPPGAAADVLAGAVAQALRGHAYSGGPVVLAIPSAWCLAAAIDTTGLPRAADRAALTFRLEERLPISAEDIAADFVRHEESNEALGICVRSDRLIDVIALLESNGVSLGHVVPRAMLVARAALVTEAAGAGTLVWPEGQNSNLVVVRDGRPYRWVFGPPESVDRNLKALAPTVSNARVRTIDAPDDEVRLACTEAARVVSGQSVPFVDLRRDRLAQTDPYRRLRTPINAVLAAAAVLLFALTCVFVVRGAGYRSTTAQREEDQRQMFREAFPTSAEPEDVRARIESEYRRATRQAADASDRDDAFAPIGALTLLGDVLSAAAGDSKQALPFTFQRMDFREAGFDLSGSAPSYVVADELARAVAAKTRINVMPAQASRNTDGSSWTFTLRGERVVARAALSGESERVSVTTGGGVN